MNKLAFIMLLTIMLILNATISMKAITTDDDNDLNKGTVQTESQQKAAEVVKYAWQFLGTPYQMNGMSSIKGFDSSGFVAFIMNHFGYELPRTSPLQSKLGKKVRLKKVTKGDLLFFRNKTKNVIHVGIVVSKKGDPLRMIHSTSSKGVIITDVSESPYWLKRIRKARRLIK